MVRIYIMYSICSCVCRRIRTRKKNERISVSKNIEAQHVYVLTSAYVGRNVLYNIYISANSTTLPRLFPYMNFSIFFPSFIVIKCFLPKQLVIGQKQKENQNENVTFYTDIHMLHIINILIRTYIHTYIHKDKRVVVAWHFKKLCLVLSVHNIFLLRLYSSCELLYVCTYGSHIHDDAIPEVLTAST